MKGLIVSVYRNPLGDCTNGGVSSKHTSVVLVGRDVPEIFDVRPDMPALYLVWFQPFGLHPAFPIAVPELPKDPAFPLGGKWMFGGNFIFSSDSRFRELSRDVFGSPIPVYDRTE